MLSVLLSIVSMLAGGHFISHGHPLFGWLLVTISYLNMVYEIIEKIFL